MQKIGNRFLKILQLLTFSILGTLAFAVLVALRHLMETPQPLESILPGDAHIYRWKHGHIFYKVLGDEQRAPIVLLHAPGVGASAYEMRKIVGALAQQYRVYAPDLPGFGLSDRPQMDYAADTYIHLLHDFLSEVVKQPATLLASGLSCNYAVVVANRFPELCQRLILISPVELFGGEQKQDLFKDLIRLPATGSLFYPLLCTRAALRIRIARLHQLSQETIPASDVDYLYASTHQFGGQHAPMALLSGKLTLDASQQFEELTQPTLILWGAHALDNVGRNKLRPYASQHYISPKTQIVLIQDAGLYVHEEYPAMVIENIRAWSEERIREAAPLSQVPEQAAAANDTAVAGGQPVEAYCMKCKMKRVMQDVQEVIMKNGRPALQGACAVCGTRLYRIGKPS